MRRLWSRWRLALYDFPLVGILIGKRHVNVTLRESEVLTAPVYALAAVFTAVEVAVAECRSGVVLIAVEYGYTY